MLDSPFYIGDTWDFDFSVEDEAGVFEDLNGYKILLTIRKTLDVTDTADDDASVIHTQQITVGTSLTLQPFTVPRVDTLTAEEGTYYVGFAWVTPSGSRSSSLTEILAKPGAATRNPT